jgi:RNA polymerase sigma-70 factor, ECF subfamily
MHSSDPTDLILLQRIVARDSDALASLYDRHSRLLFGLILRIVRDRAEAEDILQEVFVRVWTRAELFDPRLGGPTAWLVRIARNRAIDRLRARRSRDADRPPLDESIAERPAAATDIVSPEAAALEAERRGTVIDALSVLPPEQRRLIEAAFFEGYTHGELATRFGLPLGTVKTRIRAGIVAMRQRLEHVV